MASFWVRRPSLIGLGSKGGLFRSLAFNFALPMVLACLLTHYLHEIVHPSDLGRVVVRTRSLGRVVLRLKLPGTHAGIPEPLIACGRAGEASLVFIRLLPNHRAKVGVEFWNLELDQGPEFELRAADAEIELTCDLPAFYPLPGDRAWGRTPAVEQQRRHHEFRISVDGVVRLKGSVNYANAPHPLIYFGVNPLGGSFVSNRFTGTILQITQSFDGAPDPVRTTVNGGTRGTRAR
jgi:hypothetical protein